MDDWPENEDTALFVSIFSIEYQFLIFYHVVFFDSTSETTDEDCSRR